MSSFYTKACVTSILEHDVVYANKKYTACYCTVGKEKDVLTLVRNPVVIDVGSCMKCSSASIITNPLMTSKKGFALRIPNAGIIEPEEYQPVDEFQVRMEGIVYIPTTPKPIKKLEKNIICYTVPLLITDVARVNSKIQLIGYNKMAFKLKDVTKKGVMCVVKGIFRTAYFNRDTYEIIVQEFTILNKDNEKCGKEER